MTTALDAQGGEQQRRVPVRRKGFLFGLNHILVTLKQTIGPITRVGIPGLIGIVLGLAALASAIVTYLIFSGVSPFGDVKAERKVLLAMLSIDVVVVLGLGTLIAWRLIGLWLAVRRGTAASRLHVRMVTLFSVVAIIPAIIVAVLSGVTTSVSLNALLGEPVPTAINNSATMARFYVDQQVRLLEEDLRSMAIDLSNNARLATENPKLFQDLMKFQTAGRHLSSAYLVRDDTPFMSAEIGEVPPFAMPRSAIMEQAALGKVAIFTDYERNSQIRGILKLPAFDDAYLIVSRKAEQKVLDHLTQMKRFIVDFTEIEANRSFIELIFSLTYVAVALMVLLGAIWLGFRAANTLTAPIGELVEAAERVSSGDLQARVTPSVSDDEIGTLGDAFNRMTGQLQSQHNALLRANEQLDQRRRFTEAVLAGVSAGVLGVDNADRITIANRSAMTLLGAGENDLVGRHIRDVIPEILPLIAKAKWQGTGHVQQHLALSLNGQTRNLNVQITKDPQEGEGSKGYVVTFDDITRLVSAQRTAAWADVARRIAHEIKNPLTPIQLSAERLRRKYRDEVSSDRSVFEQCTDTIIRQVKDIGRMVDEFSSFARMPAPVIREEEMTDLVKRTVFPQRVANSEIDYRLSLPDHSVVASCDGRLIAQALTNLLKNAAEAISIRAEREKNTPNAAYAGQIDVVMHEENGRLKLSVEDNGCGFPSGERNRLTEPYITTRAKGTGLGLAIVKKIMEEHGGELVLEDALHSSGARVILVLPVQQLKQRDGKDYELQKEKVSNT